MVYMRLYENLPDAQMPWCNAKVFNLTKSL